MRQVTSDDHYLDLIGKSYATSRRQWFRCVTCGHVHNSVRLTDSELEQLYKRFRDQEWRNETPDEYFDRITSLPLTESENSKKMDIIEEWTRIGQRSSGSALDVGCGGGVLIETMRRRLHGNWSFFGVEPTSSFAELASRRTGAHVVNSNYQSGIFGAQKFELITCCQVLEHLGAPNQLLSDVRSDLAGDGYFYLEVPDISDFETLPDGHDRFMAQHVSYFSEPVLRAALEQSGFNVVQQGVATTVRGRNNLWFVSQALSDVG